MSEASPMCFGLSMATAVATQSRNMCGNRPRPNSRRVRTYDSEVRELRRSWVPLARPRPRRGPDEPAELRDCRTSARPAGGPADARQDIVPVSGRAPPGEPPRKATWVLISSAEKTIRQRPPTFMRCRPSRTMARFLRRTGRYASIAISRPSRKTIARRRADHPAAASAWSITVLQAL